MRRSTISAIVAVFSLEMSKESLLRRMLASQAGVDQRKLQTGFLGQEDHGKLQNALGQLVESHMFIDDTAGISLAEMRAKARRLKQTARRTRPDCGGLPATDVGHAAFIGQASTMRTAPRRSRPSRAA